MKLLKPPQEHSSCYKYKDHINEVVNGDLILSIKKSRTAYYPDNEGIPTIEFWFGGENRQLWYFGKGDEAVRDKTYEILQKREK